MQLFFPLASAVCATGAVAALLDLSLTALLGISLWAWRWTGAVRS
jgi:hypothetical protein